MLFLFLYALLATLILIPVGRVLAINSGFVDAPGGRKTHVEPVAPIGGLVILPVFLFLHLFYFDWNANWTLYLGLIALLTIGCMDDRSELNPWVKFGVQLVVSFLVVLYGECHIENLGDMFGFGDLTLSFMSIPFSVAAVMLLINAINLMDGLDGLAGGQSFIIFGLIAFVVLISGEATLFFELVPMLGALFGFLVYNMRHPWRERASVFLGDAGTLALGLALAWYAISAANRPSVELEAISVAWILALPIMDECAQFYRRVREGRHPFAPDRGHFHHHFVDAGYTAGKATVAILLFSFVLGALGYVLVQLGVPQIFMTSAWILAILTHMHLTQSGDFYKRFLSRN